MRSMDVRVQRPVRPVEVAGPLRGQRARTRGASLVCAMSCSGSFRDEPCHHASLCVWRQPCADECLNLTYVEPARPEVATPKFGGQNQCFAAAEEAARVACASGVFMRGPNELVNWRRSPAGAQGTNMGHQNREAMAHVGVHVELTVRFLTIGTPWKHTTAEVEVRACHGGC